MRSANKALGLTLSALGVSYEKQHLYGVSTDETVTCKTCLKLLP